MNLPLRRIAVAVAGLVCFCVFLPAQTAQFTQARTSPAGSLRQNSGDASSLSPQTAVIPGPLRSFLRMAGISQEISPDQVMPLLARNISLWGYDRAGQTEYLRLLIRYVYVARELQYLAGTGGVIRVADCKDAVRLIQVLGYEFHHACGQKDAYLATANAERAFLTVDSGFPLTRLEEALQRGAVFTYAFAATRVPILSSERNWAKISPWSSKVGDSLLDILLYDRNADRLYAALAGLDLQAERVLVGSLGLRTLLPYAPLLDLYGSQICIRSGTVAVPGGAGAEQSWRDLVGADPRAPASFMPHLITRDHGWLVAYFDALSRVRPSQQIRLIQGQRLKRVYEAYRSAATVDSAATGVFPRNVELLLLFTRVRWDANGEPQVPGNLAVWKGILRREPRSQGIRDWARRTRSWDSPERLLEALAASSQIRSENSPLQLYLALSAIDRGRPLERRLSGNAVELLAAKFPQFYSWYSIFAEFPALDDGSIASFIKAAGQVNSISNQPLRANALGSLQAEIGLWQILARQGQISSDAQSASWQDVLAPFNGVASSTQLFNAGRNGLRSMVRAATGSDSLSADRVIDLLAGPSQTTATGRRVHEQLAERIRVVMNAQQLVSLDSLFALYDGLDAMAHGAPVEDQMLEFAGDLREFEVPRPVFSGNVRASWSPVIYSNRHAELQVRTDLTKVIRAPASPAQLEAARAWLTPFLRDTLVGLNYAYYEPPGAQVLENNPLFVRAQDFSSESVYGLNQIWGPPKAMGVGVGGGGGAFLLGSLADLPYALAAVEEDFIAPAHVQALIWRAIVPILLENAAVTRWWSVSRNELHAAALYQRAGEEILTAAARNPALRAKALSILTDCLTTHRLESIEAALQQPESAAALISQMRPTDTFYLATEFRRRFPAQAASWGDAGSELDELVRRAPRDTNAARLRRDFGVPHPAMAQSHASTLLFTDIFPVAGGVANRLFGESWESTNLYWARLADEKGYAPAMLNILVPALTRHMVANIFGTNTADWPALLRAMEETAVEFRQGRITVQGMGPIGRQVASSK